MNELLGFIVICPSETPTDWEEGKILCTKEDAEYFGTQCQDGDQHTLVPVYKERPSSMGGWSCDSCDFKTWVTTYATYHCEQNPGHDVVWIPQKP